MIRPGTAAAGLVAAAALGIAALGNRPEIAGIPAREAVALLALAAGTLWLTAWAIERSRPGWRDATGAVVMWAVFVAGALSLYAKRDAALEGLRDFAAEVGWGVAPTASLTSPGEVAVTRQRDGTFVVPTQVNGRSVIFLFDTGASSVVLTSDTAQALGFDLDKLRFRVPVLTANGRALTAPVTIDQLGIGSIKLAKVPALVSAPGVLHQNLLGQTVLDRLDSFEVRGNRLVLRAGKV